MLWNACQWFQMFSKTIFSSTKSIFFYQDSKIFSSKISTQTLKRALNITKSIILDGHIHTITCTVFNKDLRVVCILSPKELHHITLISPRKHACNHVKAFYFSFSFDFLILFEINTSFNLAVQVLHLTKHSFYNLHTGVHDWWVIVVRWLFMIFS